MPNNDHLDQLVQAESDRRVYALMEALHAVLKQHEVIPCERIDFTAHHRDGHRIELNAYVADGSMLWTGAVGSDSTPTTDDATPEQ